MSNFILGGLIGLLAGLFFCYYKQIKFAYDNQDVISAAANEVSATQTLLQKV